MVLKHKTSIYIVRVLQLLVLFYLFRLFVGFLLVVGWLVLVKTVFREKNVNGIRNGYCMSCFFMYAQHDIRKCFVAGIASVLCNKFIVLIY